MKNSKGTTERREQNRDIHGLTQQTKQRPTVRYRYRILANKMTAEDISLHQTGTFYGDRPSNYTQTAPDDCTMKNITDISSYPTQDIISTTNFHTSSCTSETRKHGKIQLLSSTLQLDKRHKMLYATLHFKITETTHYWTPELSSESCPKTNLWKVNLQTPKHSWKNSPPQIQDSNIKWNIRNSKETSSVKVFHSRPSFRKNFFISPTIEIILIGMSFFEKYAVTLDKKNLLVHLSGISMQVRWKSDNKCSNSFIELQTTQKTVMQPFQQLMVPVKGEAPHALSDSAVEATPGFDRKEALLVSPALVTLVEGTMTMKVTNPHNHTYTLDSCVAVASFNVMTPHQAAKTKAVPHAQLLLMNHHAEECEHSLNHLFHEQKENDAKRWYAKPETCDDPTKLNKTERRIYDRSSHSGAKNSWSRRKPMHREKNFFVKVQLERIIKSMKTRKPDWSTS